MSALRIASVKNTTLLIAKYDAHHSRRYYGLMCAPFRRAVSMSYEISSFLEATGLVPQHHLASAFTATDRKPRVAKLRHYVAVRGISLAVGNRRSSMTCVHPSAYFTSHFMIPGAETSDLTAPAAYAFGDGRPARLRQYRYPPASISHCLIFKLAARHAQRESIAGNKRAVAGNMCDHLEGAIRDAQRVSIELPLIIVGASRHLLPSCAASARGKISARLLRQSSIVPEVMKSQSRVVYQR